MLGRPFSPTKGDQASNSVAPTRSSCLPIARRLQSRPQPTCASLQSAGHGTLPAPIRQADLGPDKLGRARRLHDDAQSDPEDPRGLCVRENCRATNMGGNSAERRRRTTNCSGRTRQISSKGRALESSALAC